MLKITIVTVCYNAVDTIEETIKSVINQTYDDIEYIVIDGGSTDGTVDIIKQYADQISYWVSEPDKGIFDAMNKGINLSTGDYINFMNAGDRLYQNTTIQKCATSLLNQSGISVLYGSTLFKNKNKYKVSPLHPFFRSKKKLKPMGICHQSLIVSTKEVKKNLFDLSYRYSADYAMINSIFQHNGIFKEYKGIIAVYDTTGVSSVNATKRMVDEARICGISHESLLFKRALWLLRIKSFIKTILYK